MARRILLDNIDIPESCIHRIMGENDPESEAVRYSSEILRCVRSSDDLPVFDHIILGMGNDGHTASIFPGNAGLLHSEKICGVAIQPETGQKRVTLTGGVINNADFITFLVTGKSKSVLVDDIFNRRPATDKYPAAHIAPFHGKLNWMVDVKLAAHYKSREC